MITVTIEPKRITLSGHAEHGSPGQDIACAAVTALAQTYANSMDYLTMDEPDIISEHGFMSIGMDGVISKSGNLLTGSFLIGLDSIREEFPECIEINIKKTGQAWNPLKATGTQA